MIVSWRVFEKQFSVSRGDIVPFRACLAHLPWRAVPGTCAHNTCTWRKCRCDMSTARLRESQFQTGEELRLLVGRMVLPSAEAAIIGRGV